MIKKVNATGWYLSDKRDFHSGEDSTFSSSGEPCTYIKSVVPRPKTFGFLSKTILSEPYRGKLLKMSAWVKTALPEGAAAQLWIRVPDEKKGSATLDNMFNSRIKGITDWKLYEVAINVPDTCDEVIFGVLLDGTGQVWLNDVTLESAEAKAEKLARTNKRSKDREEKS